jgi:hypothetical protein
MKKFRRSEKRFGRNAADVQASAAHFFFFDEQDLLAHPRGMSGGFISTGPRANHN